MMSSQNSSSNSNPYLQLMLKAADHAAAHGASVKPALSPADATVRAGMVPLAELQRSGFRVVPWTVNDPERMRVIIRLGVDGLISDRPDLLQKVLAQERSSSSESMGQLQSFDVSGHRGSRGLRPENTLPAFEAALDNLVDTIETDIGVTSDHVSLLWHDQFLDPRSCRKADGSPYTMDNRIYIRDIALSDAQAGFICDKLHFEPDQKNDLALSPVSVAFAEEERLMSPYVPTYVEQLFRFTWFYADYYRDGDGKGSPDAKERAEAADRVGFKFETKILPDAPILESVVKAGVNVPVEMLENRTFSPQLFVDSLCGAIRRRKMQARSSVLSFDFRTLICVEEKYPEITTYYLTEDRAVLATEFVPANLRAQ